ncbi:recombinase family protein [Methylobacterium nodulans]|uniref:recombinase family protein n=1 Tax=Methylobacterium nodulans TaxID=114616 RepID=UPI0009FFB2A8
MRLGGDRGNLSKDGAKGRAASATVGAREADSRAEDVFLAIRDLRASGASLRATAAKLNQEGIPTARGGEWSVVQVARVLSRIESGTA